MKCIRCKKEIAENVITCPYCGSFTKITKGQIFILLGLICILFNPVLATIFFIIGIIDLRKYFPALKNFTKPVNNQIPEDEEKLKEFYQTYSKNDEQRIRKAKFEDFTIKNLDKEFKCAKILNKDKNQTYNTTLQSCTCQDFKKRNLPCKHIVIF